MPILWLCSGVQYVEEAQDMAMQALTENRHILDQLAEHLLENYRISGLVRRSVMPGTGGNEVMSSVQTEQLGALLHAPRRHLSLHRSRVDQ